MTAEPRYYLDAVSGQPWSEAAQAAHETTRNQAFAAGSGVHFEASISRRFHEASMQTLQQLWQTPHIYPVSGLSAAFRLALSAIRENQRVALNPLNRKGLVDLVQGLTSATFLESDEKGFVHHAVSADVIVTQAGNQEVGTISTLRHDNSALIIADATEHVGRMTLLPEADIIVARASAWAGPADACFVIDRNQLLSVPTRTRVSLAPDLPSLVASVAALENVPATKWQEHFDIIDTIRRNVSTNFEVLGDSTSRLAHIVSLIAHGIDGEALASELNKRGFAVGCASACLVDAQAPSHVLAAMGKPDSNHIRISLPVGLQSVGPLLQSLEDAVVALK